MATIVHFELPSADVDRAKGFWSGVFGWNFAGMEGPFVYPMTEGEEPVGAIFQSDEAGSGPIVYMATDDIDATLAKVREAGGTADEKQPIPRSAGSPAARTPRATRSRSSRATSRCPATSAARAADAQDRTGRARAPRVRASPARRARRTSGRARCRGRSSRPRPRALLARDAADDRHEVEDEPEEPGPAVVDASGRPTRSATNDSSAPWISGVVTSSVVNSSWSAESRNPPARMRPSGVCCQ